MDVSLIWDAITRRQKELRIAAVYTLYKRSHLGERVLCIYEPEDLVQDAILKVMRNPDQVVELGENDAGLLRLFYSAMYHVILDWGRRKINSRTDHLHEEQSFDSIAPAVAPIAEDILAQQEREAFLDKLLTKIGEHSVTNELVLRYQLDAIGNGVETAKVLGIKHNNYKQRTFDGIRQIRKHLKL